MIVVMVRENNMFEIATRHKTSNGTCSIDNTRKMDFESEITGPSTEACGRGWNRKPYPSKILPN
jgi:hypothetical protein